MSIELNGNKMVPLMKDSYGSVSAVNIRKKVPSGGFQWYTHYVGDAVGTVMSLSTTSYKEVWPNQYNEGYEVIRSNPRTEALVHVGNIGTLMYVPDLTHRPSAGHINGTGNVRAEYGTYSNNTFTPYSTGTSQASKFLTYTSNNEVSWPYNQKFRLQTENSFWDSSNPFKFEAFAYYLVYVYNMGLSLDNNPFRWNIYSSYKQNNISYIGENNCTQDVVATRVLNNTGYEAWLIKSKKSSSGYLLKQDNTYQSSFADFLYNLKYVDFPQLRIGTTTSQGWFQIVSMGMELWCYQHS